jgi:inositol-phosphate transport system ATP-binding protein
VEGDMLRIYHSRIPIPKQYGEIIKKLNITEVLFGFRPHDAEIVRGEAEGIKGEIYSFEPLGREQIITVAVDSDVFVKVFAPEEEHFRFGEKVTIVPREDRVILFDKKTEKALEYL